MIQGLFWFGLLIWELCRLPLQESRFALRIDRHGVIFRNTFDLKRTYIPWNDVEQVAFSKPKRYFAKLPCLILRLSAFQPEGAKNGCFYLYNQFTSEPETIVKLLEEWRERARDPEN